MRPTSYSHKIKTVCLIPGGYLNIGNSFDFVLFLKIIAKLIGSFAGNKVS